MSQVTPTAIDELFTSSYLSLSTRRKNGARVATPVWFAGAPQAFYVFSAGDAGKVKRLKNFSDVQVAPCSASGKVRGSWLAAEATLINDEDSCAQAYKTLKQKYGWQLGLIDMVSRLGGRYDQRQLIRIVIDGSAAS